MATAEKRLLATARELGKRMLLDSEEGNEFLETLRFEDAFNEYVIDLLINIDTYLSEDLGPEYGAFAADTAERVLEGIQE